MHLGRFAKIGALVSAGLLAWPGHAAAEDPYAPPSGDDLRPKNWVIPALEVVGLHAMFSLFGRYALDRDDVAITFESIEDNLQHGWVLDRDDFVINQIGHPYQGGLAFSAARSNGLTFWESVPYVFVSSVIWEQFMEVDRPSWNDLYFTTIGGSLLGETQHRMAAWARSTVPGPRIAREALAFFFDPVGSFNRLVLGPSVSDVSVRAPPTWARLELGAALIAAYGTKVNNEAVTGSFSPQGHLGLRINYGIPTRGAWQYRRPFSWFNLKLQVGFKPDPFASLQLSGLLWGRAHDIGQFSRGVWGLFGILDYADPTVLRASFVGIGPGWVSQLALPNDYYLRLHVLGGVAPMANMGAFGEAERQGERLGFGAQATVDATALNPALGWISVNLRNYEVLGTYRTPGLTSAIQGNFTAGARLFRSSALGFDVLAVWRNDHYSSEVPDVRHQGYVARVFWTLYASDDMGVVALW